MERRLFWAFSLLLIVCCSNILQSPARGHLITRASSLEESSSIHPIFARALLVLAFRCSQLENCGIYDYGMVR